MDVSENYIKVNGTEIFYRESGKNLNNPKGVVLLLHGQKFSSLNWKEISTLEKIAAWNFHAIAIDLPGFGESKSASQPKHKATFMRDVCKSFGASKVIVISPSMSGMYSVPFLHDFGDLLHAFIPVAPVSTDKYTIQQYQSVRVPTFVVYGENDRLDFVPNAIKLLKHIPNSKEIKIADAGHACYLNQPDKWHEILQGILVGL